MHYNEATGDYINDDFEIIPNTELMFDIPYIIDKEKYTHILEKYKKKPRIKDADVVVFSASHDKVEDDGFHFEKKTFFVFPKNSPESYDSIQFGKWFEDEGRSLEVYTQFVNELMSCVCGPSKEYCSMLKADILGKIKTELSNIETINDVLIEKANPNCPNIDIVISGNCPEPLQEKAREFSEKVSNGRHYMDLEVGFIRGYQTAINKAWDLVLRYFVCTGSLEFQKEMEKAFRNAMEE